MSKSMARRVILCLTVLLTLVLNGCLIMVSGTLTGNVRDGDGSSGLSEATITATLSSSNVTYSVMSDSNGHYGMPSMVPGPYTVTFSRSGYTSVTLTTTVIGNFATILDVTLMGDDTDVTTRYGTISGKVVDGFGSPIADAAVTLLRNGGTVSSATSSSLGAFSFSSVGYGSYTVSAAKSGFETSSQSLTLSSSSQSCTVTLAASSLSAGGMLATSVASYASTSCTFSVDLYVVDQAGGFVGSLTESAFDIQSAELQDGVTFTFTEISCTSHSASLQSPYSATLLLDQSQSIETTDPDDSRLQASKVFLKDLGSGDYALVSAFASGGALPSELTTYGSFTTDGASYYSTIDGLADLVGGRTPLYNSIYSMATYTSDNGPTSNKALLVFTDGEDTEGGRTLSDIVSISASTGVKIFTIGLGSGTNMTVLAAVANSCGGAFMVASDARQLVALYGSLGKILRGEYTYYRLTYSVSTDAASFPGYFTTSVNVTSGSSTFTVPFTVLVGMTPADL